jgi:hypothetical protein
MKKKLLQSDLDARFAEMANDPDYQSAALSLLSIGCAVFVAGV